MALAAATALSTFDQGGNREDLSDVLASIIENDRETTIQLIGISGTATATKHDWVEDELSSWKSSCAEELATAETDLDVAAGDGAKFRIGTIFKIQNEPEVMQVTDISTDTLTIVRGYGSTSDPGVAYPINSVIEIISHPVQEDTDAVNYESIIRAKVYNYCQIYAKWIKVSETQEAVDKAGVDSEVAYQSEKKLMEIMRELNINTIHGIISATVGSDTVYRTSGGLIEFITGGNALDASSADLTETRLLNLLEMVYTDGGNPDTILAGSFQKRRISAFWKEYTRVAGDNRKVGSLVTQYESDFGLLSVVLERYMPPDGIIVLDSARAKVMPLTGRAVGIEDLAKTGLSTKKQIAGEYTLELKNRTKAHGYYYNLTTS